MVWCGVVWCGVAQNYVECHVSLWCDIPFFLWPNGVEWFDMCVACFPIEILWFYFREPMFSLSNFPIGTSSFSMIVLALPPFGTVWNGIGKDQHPWYAQFLWHIATVLRYFFAQNESVPKFLIITNECVFKHWCFKDA